MDGYERLAAHDPDNTAWRRDLASARNTLGSIAHRRGDWRAARAAYEAALNTVRTLAKNDPANSEWQRDLAIALTKIGMLSGAQGAIDEARAAFEESLAVRERLAAHDPGNLRWQSDLADAQAMLSDVLLRLGEAGPALERLRQALTLNEKLATAQPDNPAWQEALGDRNLALCSRLDMSGAPPDGARAACSKALSIAQALAAESPSSDRKWRLARSHAGLAEHHFRHDELAEAQANFEAARDILAALVESDAQNTQWQEDLATTQQGLSDVQFAQEDYFAGLKSFQVALRIRTKLAERDPENAAWQRALALAYERAADITLRATDNEKGALGLYRRSFKIYHEARQRSPNDLGNTLNLSITITKMGDLFWRRKEFDKALTAYRDAVQLREQVVAKHGHLPDWQHMLAESHVHLGQALFARQQVPAAIESFEAAQSLLAALFEHRQEDGRVLIDLARTTESIGSAKLHVGDTAGALAAYRTLAGHLAQLARRQPDEQNWIHGQAHAERLIADAHLADGNVDAAITHFNAGLAVLENRVQSAPDPQSWLSAIAAAAYHAGKSIAGASHDYANAVRDFLARARSPLQAIASNSALEEEQQKWLAEINALLKNTPGADEAVHQDQASPADMPSAPVSAAVQTQ